MDERVRTWTKWTDHATTNHLQKKQSFEHQWWFTGVFLKSHKCRQTTSKRCKSYVNIFTFGIFLGCTYDVYGGRKCAIQWCYNNYFSRIFNDSDFLIWNIWYWLLIILVVNVDWFLATWWNVIPIFTSRQLFSYLACCYLCHLFGEELHRIHWSTYRLELLSFKRNDHLKKKQKTKSFKVNLTSPIFIYLLLCVSNLYILTEGILSWLQC